MSKINGSITFFYYDDLEKAAKFYNEIMGFEKIIDVEFAKVYKIFNDTHIGLVDGNIGSLKPTEKKSVMLSMFVDDVDKWYRDLMKKGLNLNPPENPDYLDMRVLIFKDTEGYSLELLQWLSKPYE
jgi:uncharacterized glyoxalase superfamily protein PhnB